MKTAFSFVFLMCLVTSNQDECARDYTGGGPLAFSGVDEEIKAPWLAAIGINREKYGFTFVCSGSIITRRFIFTAAHCFNSKSIQPNQVKFGATNIESIYIEQRNIREVKKHPDYDGVFQTFYFDVALVKVDEDLQFSSRISPICLPDSPSMHPGTGLGITVQGWGTTERGGVKHVSQAFNIRSKVECDDKFKKFGESSVNTDRWIPQLSTDVLFCADADLNDKIGVCRGDSGGPASRRKYVDGKERYVLVGAVTGNLDGCEDDLPDIYNFIGNVKILTWIKQEIRTTQQLKTTTPTTTTTTTTTEAITSTTEKIATTEQTKTTTTAKSSSEAILITGGRGAEQSVEIFIPWQNTTCELPTFPDKRHGHVQSGNTLCGGGVSSQRSCLQWSVQQGGWVTLPLTLTEKRYGSSVWRVSQDSLVIMGGLYDAAETSETVSSDRDSTRIALNMIYPTWHACSIPLDDQVVLTGGSETLTRVSLYNTGGWVRDLPSLNTGRYGHGCTSYSTGGEQVLLVTGGWGDNRLDSTELLRPGSDWQEITSARLPRPLSGVRVSTVDNRVLLFGGSSGGEYSEDILEYRDGSWRKVGEMKNKRSYHGQTSINYEDFSNYCN